jgi:hypothetical protein
MSDRISEEAATQLAREMAAAGLPTQEIIRRLVEEGVDRGVAVSVVLLRSSANDSPLAMIDRGNMIPPGLNEEGRIIAAFRRCWNRQLVAAVVAVSALLLVLLGASDRKAEFLGLAGEDWGQLGFAIVVGVVIFSFINYRCPACSAYLGRGLKPSYCRRCGARLC